MATRKRKVASIKSPYSQIDTGSKTFLVVLAMSAIIVAMGVIVWYFYILNGGQTDFSLSDNFYQENQDNSKIAFNLDQNTQFTAGSFTSCLKESDLYDTFSYNTFASSVYSNVMLSPDKWNSNASRYSTVNVLDQSLVLSTARRDSKSWTQAAALMKKATSGDFKLTLDLVNFETRRDFAMFQIQLWPTNQNGATYLYDLYQFPVNRGTLRSVALVKWDNKSGGIAFKTDGTAVSDRNEVAAKVDNKKAQLSIEYSEKNGTLTASYTRENSSPVVIGKAILDKKTNFWISFANILSAGATPEIGHEAVIKNIKYVGCFGN